jgi:hypothetical protein
MRVFERTGVAERLGVDDPTLKEYVPQTFVRRPRIATASTHHRRDEQSNADGNLTGQI